MMALPTMELTDWRRDDLPDLLWSAALWDRGGYDESRLTMACFESVRDALDDVQVHVDGRLTGFEQIPPEIRNAVLERIDSDVGLDRAIPPQLWLGMQLLDEYPGQWFVEARSPVEGDESDALNALANIVAGPALDRSAAAWVQVAPTWWRVVNRTFSADQQTIDHLKTYPDRVEGRAAAESIIRSSFGATVGAQSLNDPGTRRTQVRWAKTFWRTVGPVSACIPTEDAPPERDVDWFIENRDIAFGYLKGFMEDFDSIVTHPDANDFYAPAQWEVGTALAWSAIRRLSVLITSPDMWNGEHGSHVIRAIVESRIVWTWMSLQDPSIYDTYKQYGDGKHKLMLAHLEPVLNDLGDVAPTFATDAAEHLRDRLGGDWGMSFVEVSVAGTFADKSLRAMAIEADLKDAYTYTVQPMSGALHNEWGALTNYVMTRCANPLHRFHMTFIPTLGSATNDVMIVEIALREMERLLSAVREVLGVPTPLGEDPACTSYP